MNYRLLDSIKVKIGPRTGSTCSTNNFSFEMLLALAYCQCLSQVWKGQEEGEGVYSCDLLDAAGVP
jgi:hypothetical protein